MSWAADVEAVQQEAGGLLVLHVIQSQDTVPLMLRALEGEREAALLSGAMFQALDRIQAAPRRAPALCGNCPRPIRRTGKFSIVIAVPDRPDASRGLGLAICHRCATEPAAIRAKAVTALRRLWPDGREVAVPAATADGVRH